MQIQTQKEGYKTTEFWVTIITLLIGIAATTGVITGDQTNALSDAVVQLGGIIAMVGAAFGYNLSRGVAKRDVPLKGGPQ